MAVNGKNRKIFPVEVRLLGPVPEYGVDWGLEGAEGRKLLKWRGEKIENVCDRVLREVLEGAGTEDFSGRKQMGRAKKNAPGGAGLQARGENLVRCLFEGSLGRAATSCRTAGAPGRGGGTTSWN